VQFCLQTQGPEIVNSFPLREMLQNLEWLFCDREPFGLHQLVGKSFKGWESLAEKKKAIIVSGPEGSAYFAKELFRDRELGFIIQKELGTL
jgi:hypothetical protein